MVERRLSRGGAGSVRTQAVALALLLLAGPAWATSTINTTLPAQGIPYNASPIRQNFGAAANDINALQRMNGGATAPSAPVLGTLWLDTSSVSIYTLKIWDSVLSTWVTVASLDPVNGVWVANVGGGGPGALVAAATTDLGSIPQAVITITGPGPIYSFGTSAPPGIVKFLIFAGATEIVYNAASMILPGAVTATTAANDFVVATSLGGGNWRAAWLGSSTEVRGPASTTIGHVPAWANTTGTLLYDPGTAYLGAAGLNVGVGVSAQPNVDGYAVQIQKSGSALSSFSSAAAFVHNVWTGSEAQANVNGLYGDLWYTGSAGNTATAIRGNFYTYPTSGSPAGSFPNQYFASPNIGTLPYGIGVYGRAAHYLPGTITYAAGLMADGIYNISTPGGGVVTNATGLLVVPPYATDATNNYAILIRDGACSPTCFDSTIHIANDPLILSTGSGAARNIELKPGNVSAFVDVYAPLRAGVNFVCSTQISGEVAASTVTALGTNCPLVVNAQGTGTVQIGSKNFPAATFSTPASATNYLAVVGGATGVAPTIQAAGSDTDISFSILPKGTGSVTAGSTTVGSFGLNYVGANASVPGDFAANKVIKISAGGVAYYVPAMAAAW